MWVSQTAAAKQVNVSRQRINALAAQGKLARNEENKVDLDQVLYFFGKELAPGWESKQEAARKPHLESPANSDADLPPDDEFDDPRADYRAAQTRIAQAKAEEAEHNLRVRQGMYLTKRDVENAMVESARRMRQQVEGIHEWADELHALSKQGGIEDLVRFLKVKARELAQKQADCLNLLADEADAEAHDGGA